MEITFNFESPYTLDGQPRQDLPKCEVLATDGVEWGNGTLYINNNEVRLIDELDLVVLSNVQWFAPLPTIYTNGTETL